jgi:hypothetical protein
LSEGEQDLRGGVLIHRLLAVRAQVVLDHSGGDDLEDAIEAARDCGEVLRVGRLGGARASIDLFAPARRHVTLRSVFYGLTRSSVLGDLIDALAPAVLPAVAEGRIRLVIDRPYASAMTWPLPSAAGPRTFTVVCSTVTPSTGDGSRAGAGLLAPPSLGQSDVRLASRLKRPEPARRTGDRERRDPARHVVAEMPHPLRREPHGGDPKGLLALSAGAAALGPRQPDAAPVHAQFDRARRPTCL